MVDTPQAGAAEVLYGLGAALGRRGGEDLGLIYLQLALYLAPPHPLALLSLADLYEAMKKPELAIKIYERVPLNSPLQRNAQIQLAINLDTLERTDEAKAQLEKLIAANPADLEAIMALGNVLRGRKQFAECADVYSKGVDTIAKPEKSNWVIYYFRGICCERAKQWAKAEVDLKKSLELFPDQPHVLNYLGYSWVDQGVNLDEGMRMIQRAVEQRADDGYIVDSLGWAYYRLGNIEEAVKHLERAVELKPEDPTINDHLGDAYWQVGRTLEARFQWSHARDLKPEPEDLGEDRGQAEVRPARRHRRRRPRPSTRSPAAAELAWPAARAEPAPAKVNLTLRVLGRRADGYHDIESLVVFAGVGDALTFAPGARARARPCAGRPRARPATIADNLVLKAARALADRVDGLEARPLRAVEAPAGRGRPRRRLGRCRGRLAAARARQRARARRSAPACRRRARPAPTCRSASIRARA